MNREEFYEWLDACKCDYVYEKDDYGLINITFFPTEIKENEDAYEELNQLKIS